jgi:hypothetical protein
MKAAGIFGALVVCVVAVAVYLSFRTPADVTPMGDDGGQTSAWSSLAIAVLSLATAVVALIQKLVELRAAKDG